MIDHIETQSAPRGIALALAIMIVFYTGMWMAVRAAWPAPAGNCHVAVAGVTHPALPCKMRNGRGASVR